jgi:hypothetical protein
LRQNTWAGPPDTSWKKLLRMLGGCRVRLEALELTEQNISEALL